MIWPYVLLAAYITPEREPISAGEFAILRGAGVEASDDQAGRASMKLYTLYAPPNHRDGVDHLTRADAEKDNGHFDGKTTE